MIRILMHVCCAPCFVAPYYHLKNDYDITTFWYNLNIHPVAEYINRRDCLRDFVRREEILYIEEDEYGLIPFLDNTYKNIDSRCYYCYYDRLNFTAIKAKQEGYDYFSTSLLYSKFQNHDLIKEIASEIANIYQIEFFYKDFREFWKVGIDLSKEQNMYRQHYCGCIFSEMERYTNVIKFPTLNKRM